MPEIQALSDLLVNKIAAGEVIERPASVIKELVENSLDAGATRVEIAVEQGGARLIRVTDNGKGMEPDDLALCVQPHTTSKIRHEDDLFAIRTMGFRGEALASIGAVSQLAITSRRHEADAAHLVRVVADKIDALVATAASPGTTVEVRELFFNVPARKKFMRTPQTEMGHITEQLARIALVHPQVEFRLTHNGREVHHLRPTDQLRSRIADFYGKELSENLLAISREERDLKITGLVGLPAESRSSTKWQYTFLNGRYIRDRFVTAAVREAYRGLIDPHRQPVIFLVLEIDPAAVDVNVHPTKVEVRWRESNRLYSQILSILRDRFLNADLTPDLRFKGGQDDNTDRNDPDRQALQERQTDIRRSIADFFKKSTPPPGHAPIAPSGQAGPRPFTSSSGDYAPHESGYTPGRPAAFADDFLMESQADGDHSARPPGKTLQIHNTYLITESAEGVTIIDQHALHERILFEQLSAQFSRGPLESQRLLLPETIDVSPDQLELIDTHADTLEQLGFELSPYGPNTLAVQAAPTLLKDNRMPDFLRDMLDKIMENNTPASTEQLINDLLSMMACKAAVKAGDPLSPEEIDSLMAQRDLAERSSNCPHGRPTTLRLTIADLEKQFKRT